MLKLLEETHSHTRITIARCALTKCAVNDSVKLQTQDPHRGRDLRHHLAHARAVHRHRRHLLPPPTLPSPCPAPSGTRPRVSHCRNAPDQKSPASLQSFSANGQIKNMLVQTLRAHPLVTAAPSSEVLPRTLTPQTPLPCRRSTTAAARAILRAPHARPPR